MSQRTSSLAILLFIVIASASYSREIVTLSSGWKFSKGHYEDAFLPGFDDSKWKTVSVPHDWAISGPFIEDGDGNTGKLPWKGEGWYRTYVLIPEKNKGKCIYLLFDGVMSSPEIYINGKLAGTWDYGYNSFFLDITPYILFSEKNTIAVHADTRNHDSRWYPGAGIFRKIQMIITDPVHTAIWGTHITTPVVETDHSEVRIVSTVINETDNDQKKVHVENVIFSPSGAEVARKSVNCLITRSMSKEIEILFRLDNPEKWDIGKGALYSVKTIVTGLKNSADTTISTFGIRTIRFTADDGLYLNGRRVQLKGVNLHHDLGPLGAAFNLRAMERQLELLQAMGCNAIRTSHNVAAPEVLELCDRMGILVFDEIFDKYDAKADINEKTGFDEFAHRNVGNFIVRDRNHPSVFIWSVGNEMGDVQTDVNGGFDKLKTMIRYVHQYDTTRPVTMVCDNRNSAEKRHFDFYDVHCWNYGRRYDLARQLEPSKSVIISESASTVSTRGFYELPLPEKKTDFTRSLQVSSYDLNAPWWAEIADDDFMWQEQEPYIAGEFAWTGFDYLGEPTPYTNEWAEKLGLPDRVASHSSYFGILDLCGIPKDRYYLYKSHWKPDETTVHILPHWNWQGKERQKIPVFVYTNGDCAELYLNGKSLGKKCKNPESLVSTERYRLMWTDVVYEPGEVKAVAYKEGRVLGENAIKTAGAPARLKLTPDRKIIRADGSDLSYILIEAIDKEGTPCPLADNQVFLHSDGPGKIAGVGNGNPQSYEPMQGSRIRLFYGKAMVIIQSGQTAGNIRIDAIANGLQTDFAVIKTE
jgi:beta-galactosidase